MTYYLNDLTKQGLIKMKDQEWTKEFLIKLFNEMAVESTLDSIWNKLPIKAIVGENDGILAIEDVIRVYKAKTSFEVWENLPHVITDPDLFLQTTSSLIEFFQN